MARVVKPPTEDVTGKTRVQLDLAQSQMDRLNWLMDICALETRKDLFNTALSLLEWAVKEVRLGRTIASVDKEAMHFVELAMPALLDAARAPEEQALPGPRPVNTDGRLSGTKLAPQKQRASVA